MLYVMTSSGKTWTIIANGFAFSPVSITITQGDTINFNISSMHDEVEVSQSTWNSNGTTPLSGGFSFLNGGLLTGLTVGTHYYVCTYHISLGMKGTIIVNAAAGIQSIANTDPFNLKVYPVPAKGNFYANYILKDKADVEISIIDISGKTVKTLNPSRTITGYL